MCLPEYANQLPVYTIFGSEKPPIFIPNIEYFFPNFGTRYRKVLSPPSFFDYKELRLSSVVVKALCY